MVKTSPVFISITVNDELLRIPLNVEFDLANFWSNDPSALAMPKQKTGIRRNSRAEKIVQGQI